MERAKSDSSYCVAQRRVQAERSDMVDCPCWAIYWLRRKVNIMEKSDIYKLDGNNPVRLKDEKIGLLIRYPVEDDLCGIQVYGKENIRYINCANLIHMGEEH